MKWKLQYKLLFVMILLSLFSIVLTSSLIQQRVQDHFHRYSQRTEQSKSPEEPRLSKNLRNMGMGWTRNQQFFLNEVTRSLYLGGLITILLAFILSYLAVRWMIQPMNRMMLATKKIAIGQLSYRIKESSLDEWTLLVDSFNHMADRLEKTEDLRKELISNLSHELSTPLTNIIGYLEAWSDGLIKNTDQKEAILQLLTNESVRLKKMVDGLRELSMVESESFQLDLKPVHLSEFLDTVAKSLKMNLDTKRIRFEMNIDPAIQTLLLDPVRFHQILMNILLNAIQYSESNTLIQLEAKKLNPKQVEIKITDQGIGIASKDLPHIFERFFRAEPSRSRITGGTGIGLAIAKQLILAHNGGIHATSKAGEGTCIIIRLPSDYPIP